VLHSAPFGHADVTGSPDANPFRSTGREDDGTGLYYYRARYYDPTRSRFVSEDPIGFGGGEMNVYAFVMNNPVAWVDPLGLETEAKTLARCRSEADSTRKRCRSQMDQVVSGGSYAKCVAAAAGAGVAAGLATCDPLLGGIVFAMGGIACELDPDLPVRVGNTLCDVFAEQKYRTCVVTAP
jgi:RHS repeat-associated protein